MQNRHAPDTTDRLLAARGPVHADLSGDGRRLLLTTHEIPVGSDRVVSRVTVIDIASGDERPVAAAADGDWGATWAPDGTRLAWVTADSAVTVARSVDDPTPTVLAGSTGASCAPRWSPDGTTIAVAATAGIDADRTVPYRWTRAVAAADGVGPLDDPPQLIAVGVATGERRALTADGWRWSSPRWSPDGLQILATVSHDPDDREPGQHLRVVDLHGKVTRLDLPRGRNAIGEWLPDGRWVALIAEAGSAGSGAVLHLQGAPSPVPVDHLLGDVYGDHPAELADSYDHVLLAGGDGSLVVRVGERGRHGIVTLHPDRPESLTVLAGGERCVSPVGWESGVLVATTQSAERQVELATIAPERQLTAFGPPASVQCERFTVRGAVPLDGWFLHGSGERPDRLPTVVMIHGGPHYTFGETFSIDAHALCAAGFGVLYLNPRGSTGYGDEFAMAIHGDWGPGPSSDVFAVLDHVVGLGWVDPERVGVTGNSYGGYLSAWLACTTSRFRAAVIENPVTDLFGLYAASDIGPHFTPRLMAGPPGERLDDYLRQSPLYRAADCSTPCLFVVGADDRRCPPAQAWAMHRAIRQSGGSSEVLVLPGSSHEGSTYGPPAARRAHNDAMVEWMTRWV